VGDGKASDLKIKFCRVYL
jgi:hypothetical protein